LAASPVVRELREGDLDYLAEHLRKADRKELAASVGREKTVRQVLEDAVRASARLWVFAEADGTPLAVFGAAPLPQGASPWMLGTDRAANHPRTLVAWGRKYARRMLDEYGRLLNFVDARNTTSVRWLRRIGFRIHPPVPYGPEGVMFHPFDMGYDHVHPD